MVYKQSKAGYFVFRSYTVVMGSYHLAMLLSFETVDEMKCHELQEATQITDEGCFTKSLASLVESKLFVLEGDVSVLKLCNCFLRNGEKSRCEKVIMYIILCSTSCFRLRIQIQL